MLVKHFLHAVVTHPEHLRECRSDNPDEAEAERGLRGRGDRQPIETIFNPIEAADEKGRPESTQDAEQRVEPTISRGDTSVNAPASNDGRLPR